MGLPMDPLKHNQDMLVVHHNILPGRMKLVRTLTEEVLELASQSTIPAFRAREVTHLDHQSQGGAVTHPWKRTSLTILHSHPTSQGQPAMSPLPVVLL